MASNRGKYAWLTFVPFTLLPILFGSSYIWWPSGDVLAHNGTEGILRVERHVWGVFVMVSAAAMLLVVLTGYRRGERWAWYAAFYQFAFVLAVAAIEPDWVFPIVFGVLCGIAQWRSYPRFFPSDALPSPP